MKNKQSHNTRAQDSTDRIKRRIEGGRKSPLHRKGEKPGHPAELGEGRKK